MPAEVVRLQRRITPRDWWFFALLLVVTAIATPTTVILLRQSAEPRTDDGCVSVMRAGIMGGGYYKYCGKDAPVACVRFAADSKSVAARCEALGLPRN